MLILLPPSESKTVPQDGACLDLHDMSFPQLTEAREVMMNRLADISAREDAGELLKAGPSLAEEIERNRRLHTEPSKPALEVYTGVLYDALGHESLSAHARDRARRTVVIISALWGAVTPADRIPAYRLSMGSKAAPRGTLAAWWRSELKPVLDDVSRGQLVIDCRSSTYAAAWKAPVENTVTVRVERERGGKRQVVSHMAKHYRGKVARTLLEAGDDPASPEEMAAILEPQWKIELRGDRASGHVMTLVLPGD